MMKCSLHSGHGLAKHNEHDPEVFKAEHIDYSKSASNVLWKRKTKAKDFEENELMCYETYFGSWLEKRNAKYISRREKKKVKTMEEVLKSKRWKPKETIYQVGDKDLSIPPDEFEKIIREHAEWEQATFPQIKYLDVAMHMEDEATPHAHVRTVAETKDGEPNWNKALKEMGVELPNPNEEEGQKNNRMMTYTKMCRKHLIEVCRQHGYEIDDIPDPEERGHLPPDVYRAMRQAEDIKAEAEAEAEEIKKDAIFKAGLEASKITAEAKIEAEDANKQADEIIANANKKAEEVEQYFKNYIDFLDYNAKLMSDEMQQLSREAQEVQKRNILKLQTEKEHMIRERERFREDTQSRDITLDL